MRMFLRFVLFWLMCSLALSVPIMGNVIALASDTSHMQPRLSKAQRKAAIIQAMRLHAAMQEKRAKDEKLAKSEVNRAPTLTKQGQVGNAPQQDGYKEGKRSSLATEDVFFTIENAKRVARDARYGMSANYNHLQNCIPLNMRR